MVVSEMTSEEALRLADELVGQALKETEARCGVVARFIGDCDRAGAHNAEWSAALRELHSLHSRRSGLLHRRDLIQEALDCFVGESPSNAPMPPVPIRTVPRLQQQVQIQPRRRRS